MKDEGDLRRSALDAAMHLFWSQGVEASAYPAIVQATRLNRKTLYRLWPDKAALVLETLGYYRETHLATELALLAQPGLAGLTAFWDSQESAARQPGWPGCFLLRTAAGASGQIPEVRRMALDWLDTLAEALTASILGALREMPKTRVLDAGAAAWQAVGLIALASQIGGGRGYDARTAALFRAGRVACGLPPG